MQVCTNAYICTYVACAHVYKCVLLAGSNKIVATEVVQNSTGFGQYFDNNDHETLRKFVVELTKQTLVPILNVMQKAMSEPVQARKASVGKFWNKSWKSLKNMTSTGTAQPPMLVTCSNA